MKKSSVKPIIIFSLIFLLVFVVCSGCLSSHSLSSEQNKSNIGVTSNDEISKEINKSNQGNITVSEKLSPYLYWEYELENVVPDNISEGKSIIQNCVRYSPDDNNIAVGTGPSLTVVDVTNRTVLWKKTLKGNITEISFSKDGKYLFIGEKSTDGYIYTLDSGTGKEIHSYRSADDLGTSTNPKHQPCIYKITAADDATYIAAGRYWKDSGYGLASKVYKFSRDGTFCWKLPAAGNYPQSVNWIDSSLDGKNVVFSTGDWTNSLEMNAVVYSVDENGNLRWEYVIPPNKPYFVSAAIWHGLDVTDDGSLVTAYTGDGRIYLFNDSEMKKPGDGSSEWDFNEWQSNVTTPEEVEGSYIYAYGEDSKIASENEVFYITGTTLPAYYPDDIPMAHPLENSLVACEVKTGNTSWTYNLGGRCAGIHFSPDMRFLVLPVGKDTSTGNTHVHGVHVFDNLKAGNGNSKLIWKFNTEGIVVDAAVSSGCTVAAVEAPLKLKNGDVIGKHRLIIIR